MPIGYRNVSGTIYQIGPTVEEWEPIGEYTVTASRTSSGTTGTTNNVTTSITNLYEYSRLRIKLTCTSASKLTSSSSGTTSRWWTWLEGSAEYAPICLLVFIATNASTSTTYDFTSFSNSETDWMEITRLAPTAFLSGSKASGPNYYDQDPARCSVISSTISNATAPSSLVNPWFDLNGSAVPLKLRTWARGGSFYPGNGTANSGIFSFTYKITIQGIKHKPALKVSSSIL